MNNLEFASKLKMTRQLSNHIARHKSGTQTFPRCTRKTLDRNFFEMV